MPLPVAMMLADVQSAPRIAQPAVAQAVAGQPTQQADSAPPAEAAGTTSTGVGDQAATQATEKPADQSGQPAQNSQATSDDDNGLIIVTVSRHSPGDPLEAVNIKSFQAVQAVDGAVVAPIAHVYAHDIPGPMRDGLHNALVNLREPVVAVNFLLQHRIGKALGTVARFAINSTVGLVGLVDVAKRKPFHLPHRNNGFADTMGFYGVKPGAYFYLPLIGSTTVRDLAGYILDKAALPLAAGSPFNKPAYAITTGVISSIDDRVAFDKTLNEIRQSSDPYIAMRQYYLEQRQAEIDGLHSKSKKKAKKAEDGANLGKSVPEPQSDAPLPSGSEAPTQPNTPSASQP
ncbi:VacJ family lipoprotein [Tsuneonella mangrovi]|uniref:MlaA family lipoprotein n=1 Tax=Tsuneonella mangrovi TaxID=1982042 RepID=UPI001470C261|nr:VacJ family lipoprotein [Tsuneonella mangrovi]